MARQLARRLLSQRRLFRQPYLPPRKTFRVLAAVFLFCIFLRFLGRIKKVETENLEVLVGGRHPSRALQVPVIWWIVERSPTLLALGLHELNVAESTRASYVPPRNLQPKPTNPLFSPLALLYHSLPLTTAESSESAFSCPGKS